MARRQAYHDFSVTLPSLGIKPSPDALYRYYRDQHRAGQPVPTTNRSRVYQWAKEDDWKGQLARDEETRREAEAAALIEHRKSQLGRMAAMLPDANRALYDLITGAQDEAVRLRAIIALYDRLGFVPESRTAAAKARLEEAEAQEAMTEVPQMPAADAPEEEWRDYLSKLTLSA